MPTWNRSRAVAAVVLATVLTTIPAVAPGSGRGRGHARSGPSRHRADRGLPDRRRRTRSKWPHSLTHRAQVAPVAAAVGSLPHGKELSQLKVYVGTREEVSVLCGEGTMACYDPASETMTIDGEDEEVDGISRASVIAHEYGHHIANNRHGRHLVGVRCPGPCAGAPTSRSASVTHERLAFPGNEGAHYWEKPRGGVRPVLLPAGRSTPGMELLGSLPARNSTALHKLREDVLEPGRTTNHEVAIGNRSRQRPRRSRDCRADRLPVVRQGAPGSV